MITLDNTQLSQVISGFQVPVKPDILNEIQALMDVEEPDIDEIAILLSNDVGLSAAILKIINSPFYGMNRRISEIKQAVMILGLKTINNLVTAISLKQAFKGEACISLERFWDDALDLANAMTYLGNKVKNKIPIEMLYTIGLFSECGIPLLALKYNDYHKVLIETNKNNENSIALEEKRYQTNHAVLGYFIATSWHLPKAICQLILNHHELAFIKTTTNVQAQLCLAVLKASENIVEKAKRHQESTDWPEIKDDALSILGISEIDYADIEDDYREIFNRC